MLEEEDSAFPPKPMTKKRRRDTKSSIPVPEVADDDSSSGSDFGPMPPPPLTQDEKLTKLGYVMSRDRHIPASMVKKLKEASVEEKRRDRMNERALHEEKCIAELLGLLDAKEKQ